MGWGDKKRCVQKEHSAFCCQVNIFTFDWVLEAVNAA